MGENENEVVDDSISNVVEKEVEESEDPLEPEDELDEEDKDSSKDDDAEED